jgi:hypothetical protein
MAPFDEEAIAASLAVTMVDQLLQAIIVNKGMVRSLMMVSDGGRCWVGEEEDDNVATGTSSVAAVCWPGFSFMLGPIFFYDIELLFQIHRLPLLLVGHVPPPTHRCKILSLTCTNCGAGMSVPF